MLKKRLEYFLPPSPEEVHTTLQKMDRREIPKTSLSPEIHRWIDEIASEAIQKRIRGTIVKTVRRLSESEISDISQETTARTIEALIRGDLNKHESLSQWVCSIAHNTALNLVRRRARKPEHAFVDHDLPSHEGGQREWERTHDFLRILEKVPERSRIILRLHMFDGYQLQEVADELRIPIGTVKKRFHVGLEVLRAIYRTPSALEA
ncbi:sigma-70 family RNA polymerase sigma factor [Candidatus Uhrbacteria bacterium]|nr:sigma-70 family RNA polymerase sigma factor [Candidatus Uhrbacteria bacterium]